MRFGFVLPGGTASRIRLGTMLTPLPWRRPWKLASQAITLDELSDGRAILAVGRLCGHRAREDGGGPVCMDESGFRATTPDDIRAIAAGFDENGGRRPGFDIVMEGETPAEQREAASIIRTWAEAGCTWWLDERWELPHASPARQKEVRDRLVAGPPITPEEV